MKLTTIGVILLLPVLALSATPIVVSFIADVYQVF